MFKEDEPQLATQALYMLCNPHKESSTHYKHLNYNNVLCTTDHGPRTPVQCKTAVVRSLYNNDEFPYHFSFPPAEFYNIHMECRLHSGSACFRYRIHPMTCWSDKSCNTALHLEKKRITLYLCLRVMN